MFIEAAGGALSMSWRCSFAFNPNTEDWKSTFVSGPLTALKVKAKGILQAESKNLSF